jgi:hypothetical protein
MAVRPAARSRHSSRYMFPWFELLKADPSRPPWLLRLYGCGAIPEVQRAEGQATLLLPAHRTGGSRSLYRTWVFEAGVRFIDFADPYAEFFAGDERKRAANSATSSAEAP